MIGQSRANLPRWTELRRQQHAAVVAAVLELVSEGNTQLTVAELAERAGMSRPTFYKHFPTISAAMVHTERALLDIVEEFVDQDDPGEKNGRDRLLGRFRRSFDFTCTHPEIVRFFTFFDFAFERTDLAGADEAEQREIAVAANDPYFRLFETGRADGSINPKLPVRPTYLALISSLVGTRQRLMVEPEWTTGIDELARDAYATLIEVWRNALRP
jgi:AcrR family transcriptional regulator